MWKVFDREASMVEEINPSRRRFLGTAALTIGAVRFGMIASAKTRTGERGELAALVGATTWLNSQPLTAAELDTKVVLVSSGSRMCCNGDSNETATSKLAGPRYSARCLRRSHRVAMRN